jgi:hypothetical protein
MRCAASNPEKNSDLQPGRLCALVLQTPPCVEDPRILVKLLFANVWGGCCVQFVRGDRHVVWYEPTRFYPWADVAGLHVATAESSQRYFTRAKRKNQNTAV